jgi:hypothetical protein
MAVATEKDGALATAAVAAAAGVAVYGLKKALASGEGSSALSRRDRDDDDHDDDEERNDRGRSTAGSLLETVWDSASEALLPLAEDAADAAGKWAAQNAPDVIRDRIMPRFIESFTDAA